MMGRIIEAVRRVLRVGPAPDTTPIETPFIEEMKRERDRSHRRRVAHRSVAPSIELEYLRKRVQGAGHGQHR